jgi:LmbE family N-acetylglucosaminyl deacetylase
MSSDQNEGGQGGEPLRLMTIAAHPHDATYTLGTSAHHIQRGDSVTVVSLTDGATTHDEALIDELRKPEDQRRGEVLAESRDAKAQRKQVEMENVCALFGITDVRILPFADNPIDSTPQLIQTLADIFYDVRPHIVITHAPYNWGHRGHVSIWDHDHPNTGVIVHRTMQTVAMADPQRKRAPHNVAQVFYIGVEFGWNEIDVFVDISDQVDNRIKAEALYESQGHTGDFARKRIEAFTGYAGWFGHTGYAEPFIRATAHVSNYLPLTENERQFSTRTGEQTLAKMGHFASGRGD